jgi:exopolyphosphatase/guanosine-5'-triphosphate,3'-diphosphate pyrophosphatase
MVCDVVWDEIEKWIKVNTSDYEVTLIGSGGNINKLFKMSGTGQEKPLSYIYMTSQYSFLNFDLRTKNCRVGTQSGSCRCYYSCH